jgi:hypothetical protein
MRCRIEDDSKALLVPSVDLGLNLISIISEKSYRPGLALLAAD